MEMHDVMQKALKAAQYDLDSYKRMKPLKERIQAAKAHVRKHGGGDEMLWHYQGFSISINELLDAAERGA